MHSSGCQPGEPDCKCPANREAVEFLALGRVDPAKAPPFNRFAVGAFLAVVISGFHPELCRLEPFGFRRNRAGAPWFSGLSGLTGLSFCLGSEIERKASCPVASRMKKQSTVGDNRRQFQMGKKRVSSVRSPKPFIAVGLLRVLILVGSILVAGAIPAGFLIAMDFRKNNRWDWHWAIISGTASAAFLGVIGGFFLIWPP